MGFYFRKALGFGPVRVNLSKSGVGFSVGVKGARVGVSPRGQAYVQAGRAGFYFRQNIGRPGAPQRPSVPPDAPSDAQVEGQPQHIEIIESGAASALTDASQMELLAALQHVRQRVSRFVLAAVSAVAVAGASIALAATEAVRLSAPIWTLVAVVFIVVTSLALSRAYDCDKRDGAIRLTFDVEPDVGQRLNDLHQSLKRLIACQRVWSVATRQATDDWKRNAGANTLIDRRAIAASLSLPRGVECNHPVICLPAGQQTLYFFPFGVAVYDSGGIGVVPYSSLHVESGNVAFREADNVPSDGHVLSHTWLYVNKHGGPDRRFKNNRQLPIMDYGILRFRSDKGLHEVFQMSRSSVAKDVELAIRAMPAITSDIRRTAAAQ